MKKYHLLIVLISLCFVKSPAQDNQKIENVDCDKVVLTKNPEDVKGLQRIGEIEIKAQKFYGSQASLRNKARKEMKKKAAKINATVVFIETDEFSNSPINNIYLMDIGYKEKEDDSQSKDAE